MRRELKPLKFRRVARAEGDAGATDVGAKAKVIAATAAGGVRVRKRTRHEDGRVTDDATGEVVYDPAADAPGGR